MDARRSAALIAQIDQLVVPRGQLALWSLGQAGFVIKGGATLAYIDPYLSDRVDAQGKSRRRFPPPLDPAQIAHAQVVFTTHEHLDHNDAQTLAPLMGASPAAVLVCSPQSREIALSAGIAPERIVVPRLGQRAELADLAYTAIPAAHYSYEVDQAGQSRWMGFLIECNGVSLYHAGDTLVIPELLAALDDRQIDIALLPFNGRDAFRDERGTVGNMWPREVVGLAARLGAGVLIGIHNDMFETNRVNPGMLFDELDRQAPFLRCHLLQPRELYLYAG
jgi:L-ascorbate metabolism protein UlaG (beta-lactamase superfamily)